MSRKAVFDVLRSMFAFVLAYDHEHEQEQEQESLICGSSFLRHSPAAWRSFTRSFVLRHFFLPDF